MFTSRFFIALIACIILSILGMMWPFMLLVAKFAFLILAALTLIDGVAVTIGALRIVARRALNSKMSLDQPNQVILLIKLMLPRWADGYFNVVSSDILPPSCKYIGDNQFVGEGRFRYSVVPTSRGRHEFGVVRSFVTTRLGLCEGRRFSRVKTIIKVYPTFRQLDKIEMRAANQNLRSGQQRVLRPGNNTNFDQIRAYVPGDDVRTINWHATARAAALMVNTYTDERSQPIIPIVCGGPSMLIATDGISLLDRATSAAVALASSAIRHYDEAGVLTVTHEGVSSFLPPQRLGNTLTRILHETYDFGLPPTDSELEIIGDPDVLPEDVKPSEARNLRRRLAACEADADLMALARYVNSNIQRRSLLVLFANFENIEVARNAIPALRMMARRHKLVVVMFHSSEIETVARAPYRSDRQFSNKLSDMRFRALCADYLSDRHLLIEQLRGSGINVISCTPQQLSGAVISEYLELKSRAAI